MSFHDVLRASENDLFPWKMAGTRGRALFFEFLAVQHHLRDDRNAFTRALSRARQAITSAPEHTRSQCLLLDALEAKQLLQSGDPEGAVALFRDLVAGQTIVYRRMVRIPGEYSPEDLAFTRTVISLLHFNLTQCLRRTQSSGTLSPLEDPHESLQIASEAVRLIEEHFEWAIAFTPDFSMPRWAFAGFLEEQRRWDESAEASRAAYVASLLWESPDLLRRLNADLARIYVQKAQDAEVSADHHAAADPGVASEGLEDSLKVLDDSLCTLEWEGNIAWRAKTHAERGRVLTALERGEEAAEAYKASALDYSEAGDRASAAYVRMMAGDALAMLDPLQKLAKAYREALKLTEQGGSGSDDQSSDRGSENDDRSLMLSRWRLRARLALIHAAQGEHDLAARLLEEITSNVVEDFSGWGPFYDVLAECQKILSRMEVRHPVSVLYHRAIADNSSNERLANSAKEKRDRDLTAALLDLYRFEREEINDRQEKSRRTAETPVPLGWNVVDPIAMLIDEQFTDRVEVTNEEIIKQGGAVRESIRARYGVKIPGVRVREDGSLADGEYLLMINDVALARGVLRGDSLREAFIHLESLLVANLAEFQGHQESQNYLERNLLVRPVLEDIAEKENERHMTPFNTVLNALVAERVPIEGPWEFAAAELRGVRSLALKIAEGSDPVSAHLGSGFPHDTTATEVLPFGDLRDDLLRVLNESIKGPDLYDEERFSHVTLHPNTELVLSQGEGTRRQDFLNRLLLEDAFPEFLSRRESGYPQQLYATFRQGHEDGAGLEQIVENIRQIPEIRERLWGNDDTYERLLVPESFESWLGDAGRIAGPFRVLVLDSELRRAIVGNLQRRLAPYSAPALVVRKQKHRALLRAFVADTCPEVPVLSVDELLPGATETDVLSEILLPESSWNCP